MPRPPVTTTSPPCPAGCCPAWSTRTATSASAATAPSTTRRPRSRRWPTATPAPCCCATPGRRPTPAGCRTATTCRAWCGPAGTSPAPAATSATSPGRSSPSSSSTRCGSRPAPATAGSSSSATGSTATPATSHPCWPADVLAQAVAAAHEEGARVTAHCFGEQSLRDLAAAGTDCVEHACGLEPDTIAAFAAQGIAIVPTLVNIDTFPQIAEPAREKFPDYHRHMIDLYERRYATIAAARDAGIPVLRRHGCRWLAAARAGRHRGGAPRARRVHDHRGAATPRAGARGRGWAGRGWRRGTRPTWSSTPTTRARTSPPWPRRRSSCCAASPSPAVTRSGRRSDRRTHGAMRGSGGLGGARARWRPCASSASMTASSRSRASSPR